MIGVVHFISNWLDNHLSWYTNTASRITMQLLFGVLVPLLIDFVLIATYFHYMGSNVFENGFMRHDFPVIMCFIIMLNLLYAIVYFKNSSQVPSSLPTDQRTETSVVIEPTAKLRTFLASVSPDLDTDTLDITLDILYFYSFNKQVFMVTGNGREFIINTNLNLIDNLFSEVNFARINRSVVLNLGTTVEGFENGAKRDTLSFIFFPQYNFPLKVRNRDFFVVTKHYIKDVMDFFQSTKR